MITQRQIKHLSSLHSKKFRVQHASFLVQGKTMVLELLESDRPVKGIYCLETEIPGLIDRFGLEVSKIIPVDEAQLGKISTLSTPNKMLAEVQMPEVGELDLSNGLHLFLDGVKDPGNMGTIIRIADQFGVASVLCTDDCVELYNPKVVQSTMGSIFRVKVHYGDADEMLKKAKTAGMPVIATLMDGAPLYKASLPKNMVLALGSESQGVRPNTVQMADQQLTIPNYGNTESLNVAVAAAVFCSEFRARSYRD